MIKLKDILNENQILITEKFAANLKIIKPLGKDWKHNSLCGVKLGVEWDKIKDSEIETNTKPKKKGY